MERRSSRTELRIIALLSYVVVALLASCTALSPAQRPPSSTAAIASASPTSAGTVRPSFTTLTDALGVVWEGIDEPPGPAVAGVASWVKGTWPDRYTTTAAIFVPPGSGPFPAVVYMSEAAGLTQAQLDVARRIADGGFVVVAGCDQGFARVQCQRRRSLFETDAAFIELAKRAPRARGQSVALVGASTNATSALYLAARRSDISAIVADSGVGLDYPAAPVLILATRSDGVIADSVAQGQAFESSLRAPGSVVESHYYDGGAHIVLVAPATTDDAVRRAIAFLDTYAKR